MAKSAIFIGITPNVDKETIIFLIDQERILELNGLTGNKVIYLHYVRKMYKLKYKSNLYLNNSVKDYKKIYNIRHQIIKLYYMIPIDSFMLLYILIISQFYTTEFTIVLIIYCINTYFTAKTFILVFCLHLFHICFSISMIDYNCLLLLW